MGMPKYLQGLPDTTQDSLKQAAVASESLLGKMQSEPEVFQSLVSSNAKGDAGRRMSGKGDGGRHYNVKVGQRR